MQLLDVSVSFLVVMIALALSYSSVSCSLQVAVHSAMQLPDVRVSFLGVMTALAAGAKGSRFILAQFRQNASKAELEHFTWRKLFATIVAYCRLV
jgi:hypothetical protein